MRLPCCRPSITGDAPAGANISPSACLLTDRGKHTYYWLFVLLSATQLNFKTRQSY